MRRGLFVLILGTALAACTAPAPPPPPAAPPPPPPPPPAVQELPPPDPFYFNFVLPEKDATGAYVTPNSDIGPLEQLFHFRSAMNVAALSCRFLEGYDLAPQYNAFIKQYAQPLREANRAIDAKFRRENGAEGSRLRDSHMTSLYNHFARPATLDVFCPLAQRHLTAAAALTEASALQPYAETALAEMEQVFQAHFAEIEEYQRAYRAEMIRRGQTPPPIPTADGVDVDVTVDPAVGTSS